MNVKQNRFIKIIRTNIEQAIILMTTTVIAILSLLDIVHSTSILIAATLAVLSIMAFAHLRENITRDESEQEITEIPGKLAMELAFEDALTNATSWDFRGCTGSFLRAETLPRISRNANTRAVTNIKMTVQILDPDNAKCCREYAAYRRMLAERRGEDGKLWTSTRVQHQCLASLIAATWYHQRGNLEIELGLLDKYSPLRLDASDQVMLITNEDPGFPVLFIRERRRIYYAFASDLRVSMKSSRKIDLEKAPALPLEKDDISSRKLIACTRALGISRQINRSEAKTILELAFKKKDWRNP